MEKYTFPTVQVKPWSCLCYKVWRNTHLNCIGLALELPLLEWLEKYSPNCIGLALELPLLEWLEKYTFPTEAKFSQSKFSTEVRKIQYFYIQC
jgi:hypothetical protein